MSTFEDEIQKKKLPKIVTPYSVPKNLPYAFSINTEFKKNKNKQAHKSRHHYSTIGVV